MSAGAITDSIDVAQLTLYAFWLFFAGLIIYLRREDKREGYPLEQLQASPYTLVDGFPGRPDPKTFHLPHGGTRVVPVEWMPERLAEVNATPVGAWLGAPLRPIGNPMLANVGPGAYAQRPDEADLTIDGENKIVPLRIAPDYSVASGDPDPRGHSVFGADNKVGGVVRDIWVDRSERLFRYYELEVTSSEGTRRALLPVNFSKVNGDGTIKVHSILSTQFANVPGVRQPDMITMLEEEKVVAYFGAGTLYATPARSEPLV